MKLDTFQRIYLFTPTQPLLKAHSTLNIIQLFVHNPCLIQEEQ